MNTEAQELLEQLRACGLVRTEEASLRPLAGGVSSDIYRVDDGGRSFVVKRALEKLKVEADWYADTSRNDAEQAYIRYVAAFRPDAVPEILHSDAAAGYFCMEFLAGLHTWKEDLLAGECDAALARKAGELLGEVHARSWGDAQVRARFDHIGNFDELRIDPYLRASAAKHPDLEAAIHAEARRLRESRECLVHGDYSPKNLLHGGGRLVALDCEVACCADAAFDLSFLLNHLFLKSLFHAPARPPLRALIGEIRTGYRDANAGHADAVERRTARLLPMLMLARVDGKSPVEYLTEALKRDFVRDFARHRILNTTADSGLDGLEETWFRRLGTLA